MRLIDTAGIRETADLVERKGVERSRQAMESAALILLLEDGTLEADGACLALRDAVARTGKPWIYIATKRDLSGLASVPSGAPDGLSLSVLTGEGLDALERAVAALFPAGDSEDAGSLLTDQRQAEAAGCALASVRRARAALECGMTADAVLADAEAALSALGELTGRTLREDLVTRIFERFCVGK